MTHFYGQPIAMTCDARGQPERFTWRGREYVILEILAAWRLRDRWWLRGAVTSSQGSSRPGTQGASDRTYYRVRCAGEVYGEIYYDAVGGRWVLDRVYD